MRKLAKIVKIDELNPIEGADAIECAVVGGWKVVAQKGLYNVGDLAVYFEIDSWIPIDVAPFLQKGDRAHEFEGVAGNRLRTVRLRGQLSQGLLMPLKEVMAMGSDNDVGFSCEVRIEEGFDMTEALGIKKWEKPVNAQLAGVCRGNFPSLIPKTDQERVQNLKKEIASGQGDTFEVTEKLEGSSMTVYRMVVDGEMQFGVCSRNMDLKETQGNSFWDTARANDIEAKMIAVDEFWSFAIQGELIGPGIQGNIYGLKEPMFYVFDVYDVQAGEYLPPDARRELIERMGLNHAPVLNTDYKLEQTVDEIIASAEGQSVLAKTEREGIVFKETRGGFSFKAISNKYLLGEK